MKIVIPDAGAIDKSTEDDVHHRTIVDQYHLAHGTNGMMMNDHHHLYTHQREEEMEVDETGGVVVDMHHQGYLYDNESSESHK